MDVFLDYILSVSTLRPSVRQLRPSMRDPDDKRILEVWVQCHGIIVTHNQRDFDAAVPCGVKIMSRGEVLEASKGSL